MTIPALPVTFPRSMASNGFIARGKVVETKDSTVVFTPLDTNYQLYLETNGRYTGPMNQIVEARIRAKARKVYTVPSGGGFIAPIFGSPRTIQGRALLVEDRQLVLRASIPITIELPQSEDAIDLDDGSISVGAIVNVVAFPGATFELVPSSAGK
jgi:hypothetical protein